MATPIDVRALVRIFHLSSNNAHANIDTEYDSIDFNHFVWWLIYRRSELAFHQLHAPCREFPPLLGGHYGNGDHDGGGSE